MARWLILAYFFISFRMMIYVVQIFQNGQWIDSDKKSENLNDLLKDQMKNSRIILKLIDDQKKVKFRSCCS